MGILFVFIMIVFAFLLGTGAASQEERTELKMTPYTAKNSARNASEFEVRMDINSGNEQKSYNFKAIAGKTTVFDLLKEASLNNNLEMKYDDKKYSFGVFVESIDGIKDGSNGKNWQYYINGTLGDLAADKKILNEGDKVEWRFEKVPIFN